MIYIRFPDPIYRHTKYKLVNTLFCTPWNAAIGFLHDKFGKFAHVSSRDLWSLDYTLSHLLVQSMIKFRDAERDGYGFVALEDAPEHLRAEKTDDLWDEKAKERYDWMLNEVIFALEEVANGNDGSSEFFPATIGSLKIDSLDEKILNPFTGEMEETFSISFNEAMDELSAEMDWKGYTAYLDRVRNGLTLFGKYYQSFWT